jgi:hypothetical protein
MSEKEKTLQEQPNSQGVEHQDGMNNDETNAAHYVQFRDSTPEYHHAMSKTLLRKVDVHLLPLLILM